MNKLKDIEKFVLLYDLYKNLLTTIQQQDFEMYLFEDMSLEEIATRLNKSKAAVFDNLKKVEKNLLDFENKMHFAKKELVLNQLLDNIREAKTLEEVHELLKGLKGEENGI